RVWPGAHPRRAGRAFDWNGAGAPLSRRDHLFQVAGDRRRGSRHGAVPLQPRGAGRRRPLGGLLSPAGVVGSPPLLAPPSLEQIERARQRIRGSIVRSPLVRLNADGPAEIYLKLENLQPIGSFKLRGAGNARAIRRDEQLASGVWTASAGNMAQGVAWNARRLGIPCAVVVPEHASEVKLAAIARLGAGIVKVPFHRWWQVLVEHRLEGMEGVFIHPVSN